MTHILEENVASINSPQNYETNMVPEDEHEKKKQYP